MIPNKSMPVLCGPSGWERAQSVARSQNTLSWIAEHFDAVEIAHSFREVIRPEVASVWLRKVKVNPRFEFTAKLHKTFTHDRILSPAVLSAFKQGVWPLLRAGRLSCLLMQFPWSFRFTAENRTFLIRLRRTFHEFPLAAEMRHASWMSEEALGTFIDYRIGFCNIDQPGYSNAMPPTAFLTSGIGYFRLHGRDAFRWFADTPCRYDYLYSESELSEWKVRVQRVAQFAEKTFVITNNDDGGKALINGLQMKSFLRGGDGRDVPPDLLRKYPQNSSGPLFSHFPGRAVA